LRAAQPWAGLIHLIFSTKNRERLLADDIRPELHAYLGGILRGLDSPAIEINTEPDHAHILFTLSRTQTLSDVVSHLKRGSSVWLKTKSKSYSKFHWQNGFGAFSVSQSAVDEVRAYIRNQATHHQKVAFQDEFRAFLKRHAVDFDERYVWD
jgi:REP element-mobilizing transposase RayT